MPQLSEALLIKWACVFTKNKLRILFHLHPLSTQIPCGRLHYFHWKWSRWPGVPFVALLCYPTCPALAFTASPGCSYLVGPVKSDHHWANTSQGSSSGTPGERYPVEWALPCRVTGYSLKRRLLGKTLFVLVVSHVSKPLQKLLIVHPLASHGFFFFIFVSFRYQFPAFPSCKSYQ